MLYNLELLAKTTVVEVTGRSLCAEYVGQTSHGVDEAMKKALGGVLFIGAQTKCCNVLVLLLQYFVWLCDCLADPALQLMPRNLFSICPVDVLHCK